MWHPGVIKGYAVNQLKWKNDPSPYCPVWFYDNGDKLEVVANHYIFQRADYLLRTKDDGGLNWVGVTSKINGTVDDKWGEYYLQCTK